MYVLLMLLVNVLVCYDVGLCSLCCVLFFVQAEDGIRDLVRSRGLGDVYKRQMQHVRIDGARLQVLERTLEGLPNLGREVRSWIVGEPVILPVDEGELGLEEQRLAGAAAGRHELLHGLSHRCLLYTSPSPRDRTRSHIPPSP